MVMLSVPTFKFLSTPSARRATKDREPERDRLEISIHALREEGDDPYPIPRYPDVEFLSTPSARRATNAPKIGQWINVFLSTPSARRATLLYRSLH